MKTHLLTLALLCVALSAKAETQTIPVKKDSVVTITEDDGGIKVRGNTIFTSTGETTVVTAREVKDVIRALEILLKYAPEKYEASLTFTGTSSVMMLTSSGYYSADRKKKSDTVRDAASSLRSQARAKIEEADKMDKEQEEIDWARAVLAKWKSKLESL